ncbi:hypothetical protein ACRAKI_32595 [Saccharothrix isguenensis]
MSVPDRRATPPPAATRYRGGTVPGQGTRSSSSAVCADSVTSDSRSLGDAPARSRNAGESSPSTKAAHAASINFPRAGQVVPPAGDGLVQAFLGAGHGAHHP